METGHKYGDEKRYYCPECEWDETRYWAPPYANCPNCDDAMVRQE